MPSRWPIVLAALAAHRAARAIAVDSISKPFRDRIELWSLVERRDRNGDLRDNTGREWLFKLVTCPHCCGFWLAGAALYVSRYRQRRRGLLTFILEWWAVAALQDTLTSIQSAADESAAVNVERIRQMRKAASPAV